MFSRTKDNPLCNVVHTTAMYLTIVHGIAKMILMQRITRFIYFSNWSSLKEANLKVDLNDESDNVVVVRLSMPHGSYIRKS